MNDKSALLEQLRLNRGASADESRGARPWIMGGALVVLLLGALGGTFLAHRAAWPCASP
jgi:hypothetical protein